MKFKMTRIIILSLIASAQVSTVFSAEAEKTVDYETACVTPILFSKNGTVLVFLGQNKNTESWSDFRGNKDDGDRNNPIATAERVMGRIALGEFNLVGDPLHSHKHNQTIHLIWETTKEVSPILIRARSTELGTKDTTDKTGWEWNKKDWKWEKLENLLEGTTKLSLARGFSSKLKTPIINKFLWSLLENQAKYSKLEEQAKFSKPEEEEPVETQVNPCEEEDELLAPSFETQVNPYEQEKEKEPVEAQVNPYEEGKEKV